MPRLAGRWSSSFFDVATVLIAVTLVLIFAVATIGCTDATGDRTSVSDGPIQIRYGDDPAQFGWLTLPPEPATEIGPTNSFPVVVLVHGGFWKEPWDYTLMHPLSEALAAEGYATWNIEFRRLGGRGGWPNTFDDVAAAIDHLTVVADEHRISTEHVVLVGHSSGGHLAMWSLGRPEALVDPLAVIGLAPIVDLAATNTAAELLGGTPEDLPDRYRAAAPSLNPERIVVVHGGDDTTLGSDHAEAAAQAGVRVEHLADVDHFEIIDPESAAWPVLLEELQRLLQAG